MMLPFFVTFRTELLLLPVIGKAEVFQFFVIYFHNDIIFKGTDYTDFTVSYSCVSVSSKPAEG